MPRMNPMHFAKSAGGAYPALFYIGQFYIPLQGDTLGEIKGRSGSPGPEFLAYLRDRLCANPYLRRMMDQALQEAGDREALARRLVTELRDLSPRGS